MLAVGSRTVRSEYTPRHRAGPASALAGDRDRGDRDAHRPPRAPRAQAARVAPVVTTSSTSRTQRPATAAAAPARPREPEGAGDVRGPLVAPELELGDRRAAALERPRERQAEVRAPRPRR